LVAGHRPGNLTERLARRIARTAWSMYTYKTEFDPTRLTKALT